MTSHFKDLKDFKDVESAKLHANEMLLKSEGFLLLSVHKEGDICFTTRTIATADLSWEEAVGLSKELADTSLSFVISLIQGTGNDIL